MLQIVAPPLPQNVSVNGHFNHSGLYIETQHDTVLFSCCVRNESTRQNKDTMSKSSSSTPGIFSAGPSEGKSKSGFNHTHWPNRTHCFAHFKDIQRMSPTTGKVPQVMLQVFKCFNSTNTKPRRSEWWRRVGCGGITVRCRHVGCGGNPADAAGLVWMSYHFSGIAQLTCSHSSSEAA